MKLHRADRQPDWELVSSEQRSNLQRVAAQTSGAVTPGNVLSFVGLILVFVGLVAVDDNHLWHGLIIIGVGRLFDIVDGFAAEKTGTKSPVGEGVDAAFDKIAALASLIIFAVKHIIPWPFALIIGLENLFTSICALVAKHHDKPIHPVASGKIGGAVEWGAFLAFILGAAIHTHASHTLTVTGYVLAIVAIGLNAVATVRYAQLLSD